MQNKQKRDALFYDTNSKELALKASIDEQIFDMLNQRWSLLILRALTPGIQRFNDLSKATNVNPNTLRDRLRELESLGLVERQVISLMPPKVEYSLTEKGADLCKIFQTYAQWATKYAVVEVSEASDIAEPAEKV